MMENWKTQSNNKSKVVVVFMYLSKAFDTLNQNGPDPESSSFLQSYLTMRYQSTRIGDAFSDWESIIVGMLQGQARI